jgi:hypothetical protein
MMHGDRRKGNKGGMQMWLFVVVVSFKKMHKEKKH